jgi:intron-binding protein aquarius
MEKKETKPSHNYLFFYIFVWFQSKFSFFRPESRRQGSKRKLRVNFDPVQYYHDVKAGKDCYDNFHLIVKRDPRENNFKAILQTMKNLFTSHSLNNSVPNWIRNTILGIGDSKAAHFR